MTISRNENMYGKYSIYQFIIKQISNNINDISHLRDNSRIMATRNMQISNIGIVRAIIINN